MYSTSRPSALTALLALAAALGIVASVLLFVAQRTRSVPFDVPETVALVLCLLGSVLATVGLRQAQHALWEKERIENDLRASEHKFSGILAIAADAIVSIDENQDIVQYNEGAEQIFGWTSAETLGKPLGMLLPERLRKRHAGHVADFAHAPEVARRMGSRQTIVGRRKSGEEFAAEASISRLETATGMLFTVVLRDISERRRTEGDDRFLAHASAAIGRSLDYEATLRSVVHLPIPYMADCCILDIVMADGGTRRIASVHEDHDLTRLLRQLEGRFPTLADRPFPVSSVVDDESPVFATIDPEAAAMDGGADGLVASLGVRSYITAPLPASGRVTGALTLISTDASRVYGERDAHLAVELTALMGVAIDNAWLYETAQRAGRARDELLGVVSHDLRNPLSAVSMCAKVMLDSPPTDERAQRDLARAILQSSDIMNRMIQDLLDVSTIESGHLRITRSPQNLAHLVERVLDMHREAAESSGIAIRVDVEDDLPFLDVDGTRIIQVLANLVGNAIKFTERGGSVTIVARLHGSMVEVAVTDTGIGIPGEDLPHIFDRYWHARRTSRTLGTGLGLAIAQGIVDKHGGHLTVTSAPGKGSTFAFTIPVAADGIARDAVAAPQRT
ncbi:MAG: Adaptive-response sensory-kinase SasA [Gemmatimonadaceae bacterium]|nr:Adaptive-response sensory-kinase SasA [Gemmatimonadaceae bacterium]